MRDRFSIPDPAASHAFAVLVECPGAVRPSAEAVPLFSLGSTMRSFISFLRMSNLFIFISLLHLTHFSAAGSFHPVALFTGKETA